MPKAQKTTQKDYKLGRRIQKLRQEREYTQEKLAEKVGVSTTWIGYIETGYRRPNLAMLSKIANALRVKVNDLIPY